MNMNLLILLMTIWVFSSASLSAPPIDIIRPDPPPTVPSISEPLIPSDKDHPISQTPPNIEAPSPGVREEKPQDMNKKILIALIVASTTLGGILFFLSCFWMYKLKKVKNKSAKNKESRVLREDASRGLSLPPILDKLPSLRMPGKKGSVSTIEYQLLVAATNNFQDNNILGEGRLGCLYKASFSDDFLATVKRIHGGGQNIEKEFENEVNWLSKLDHQNVVCLLGYCLHGEIRLLVYEIMYNGSLESQLHGRSNGSALTWHLRMKIALDVARGLEYLHERCNPPVIHRDLKSSNILMDFSFNAKLSNFGLATAVGSQNKNSIKLSGTLGYVAPEYLLDGKLTDKSDVYAFGVVLLELLTGRKPVEKISPSHNQSLVAWAMPQLTNRLKLPNIVDPVIKNTMDPKHLYQVAAVAVLCVQPEPSYRPLITDILHSFIPLVSVELGGSLRVANPVPPAYN